MQTFVPYPDLRASCAVLDDRRLGKQRVETFQILRALTWPSYAWKSHPAVTMWRGFVPALVAYGLESCREWTRRGYADSVATQLLSWGPGSAAELPPWFGVEAVHLSHRSALVRKDPAVYRPLFPDVPDDLPYFWPAPVFPRWPVRREGGPVDVAEALSLLGFDELWPGQAAAVDAVLAGRDVLLTIRPGAGGSTAGLLAGLCTPDRTLWVAPPAGALAGPPPPGLDGQRADGPLPPTPKTTRATSLPAAPMARPPSPVDVLAMRAEQSPAEWVFRRPGKPAAGSFGLVVLDRAHKVGDWTRPVNAPVLAVVGRASAAARAELTARLGLRDPVVVGGGWDVPGTWLGVAPVTGPAARIEAVREQIGRHGPAVVVTATRERARRLATALTALRAAVWAPTMRPGPAAAAIGAWRSGRLDALVVPAGPLPPFGRRRVPLLLHADAPGSTVAWRDAVATVRPAAAVLLAAAGDVPAGCVRRALLEQYGELLGGACGCCSGDRP